MDGVEHLAAEMARNQHTRVSQGKVTQNSLGPDLPNLELGVRGQSLDLIALQLLGGQDPVVDGQDSSRGGRRRRRSGRRATQTVRHGVQIARQVADVVGKFSEV